MLRQVYNCQLYRGENSIQNEKAPTGTSSEAMLRRLRKHRLDLHERVLAGEITGYRASIEAGFRKPATPRRKDDSQIASAIIEKWGAERAIRLAELILEKTGLGHDPLRNRPRP
jgi:hypothetical protein